MTRYSRKKGSHGYTAKSRDIKIKRRTRDLDQIHVDMMPENSKALLTQEVDIDVTGNAQFYCLHCARYFINNNALSHHFKTKVHKRRLKALEIDPYTQKEAEAAAGMGSYYGPNTRKVETQKQINDPIAISADSCMDN